jgi:hypothetical protein
VRTSARSVDFLLSSSFEYSTSQALSQLKAWARSWERALSSSGASAPCPQPASAAERIPPFATHHGGTCLSADLSISPGSASRASA